MSLHTSLILGMTTLVLILGMIRGDQTLLNFFKLRESREILQATVRTLEKENYQLSNEIKKIQESPNYAKKILKDKYHVTESNEKIIFFAD